MDVELLGMALLAAGCGGWADTSQGVDGVVGALERVMADPIMGLVFAPRGSANSD